MSLKTEAQEKKVENSNADIKTATAKVVKKVKPQPVEVSFQSASPRPSAGRLKLIQIKSPIGRHVSQRQTLIGLGLNKLRRVSIVEDTPSVRGMITAVAHLIKIQTD